MGSTIRLDEAPPSLVERFFLRINLHKEIRVTSSQRSQRKDREIRTKKCAYAFLKSTDASICNKGNFKYIAAAQLSYMYTRLGYILLNIGQFPVREE